MSDLAAMLAEIKAKSAERDRLLAELEVWVRLKDQGGPPADSVEAFGYDEKLDKQKLPRAVTFYGGRGKSQWLYANAVYNYVRLKDGTVVPIEPIPVPAHSRGVLFG